MIQQQTLNFLKELVDNNNREWFMANKDRYDIARENVLDFTSQWSVLILRYRQSWMLKNA
jgi:uncharacterized protein (DUF2461 family)